MVSFRSLTQQPQQQKLLNNREPCCSPTPGKSPVAARKGRQVHERARRAVAGTHRTLVDHIRPCRSHDGRALVQEELFEASNKPEKSDVFSLCIWRAAQLLLLRCCCARWIPVPVQKSRLMPIYISLLLDNCISNESKAPACSLFTSRSTRANEALDFEHLVVNKDLLPYRKIPLHPDWNDH